MYDIDRNTHLKILIVGATAATFVVAVAANARSPGSFRPIATTAPAIVVAPPHAGRSYRRGWHPRTDLRTPCSR